jgi:hypothetical protein
MPLKQQKSRGKGMEEACTGNYLSSSLHGFIMHDARDRIGDEVGLGNIDVLMKQFNYCVACLFEVTYC